MSDKPYVAVVDDDDAVRDALANLVEALGYRVRAFPSGLAFLDSHWAAATRCLIADVQMPGMTGVELMDRLTRDGFEIPTILVTAHPLEATRLKAMRGGAIDYLAKPIRHEALVACLERAVP